MKIKPEPRKWLPSTTSGIVIALIGCLVLFWGITQIPTYLHGINPPKNSQAVSVSANSVLGAIQIVETVATLLVIVGLTKFSNGWHNVIALITLVIIFMLEAGMAIGYTGL